MKIKRSKKGLGLYAEGGEVGLGLVEREPGDVLGEEREYTPPKKIWDDLTKTGLVGQWDKDPYAQVANAKTRKERLAGLSNFMLVGNIGKKPPGLGLVKKPSVLPMDEASRMQPAASVERGGIKAFHYTDSPFEQYDWTRLGKSTEANITDAWNPESFGMTTSKLGPWASEKNNIPNMSEHMMPVEVAGKSKKFKSLEDLHAAIIKNGGPDAYRNKLLKSGFGNVSVIDEEFGGTSYVALRPENFKITKK